jgi:hypothetical protein
MLSFFFTTRTWVERPCRGINRRAVGEGRRRRRLW